MRVRMSLLAIALLLANPVRADEPDDDPATIAKIKLLGGIVTEANVRGSRSVSVSFVNAKRMDERFLHLLKQVESLRRLELVGVPLSDAGAEIVGTRAELGQLIIADCSDLSDDGLKSIAKLKKLKSLVLGGCTRITDQGIKELVELENLQHVALIGSRITDAGLQELGRLKGLKYLCLREVIVNVGSGWGWTAWDRTRADLSGPAPQISDDGIQRLQTVIPGVQIRN